MNHCAQRGCVVPEGREHDALCPTCRNPLIVVVYGEVSQEKPQPVEADQQDQLDQQDPPSGGEDLPPDNGVNPFTGA